MYREFNNFEEYLVGNGIHVLKFFLNMSKEKQRERLLERIARTDKRYGFCFGRPRRPRALGQIRQILRRNDYRDINRTRAVARHS
jgi:alkylation response protein AidB-like acyl-CoA dehydrogenase